MSRNSLGLTKSIGETQADGGSRERLRQLPYEGVLVSSRESRREWIRKSSDPDFVRTQLKLTPNLEVSEPSAAEFIVDDSDPEKFSTPVEAMVSERWSDLLDRGSKSGKVQAPRPNESASQAWSRILGTVTTLAVQIDIVDPYLLNDLMKAEDSNLRKVFAECFQRFSGRITLHFLSPEQVVRGTQKPHTREGVARNLASLKSTLSEKSQGKFGVKACLSEIREHGSSISFPHDRWIYFTFTNDAGVLYALGKGLEGLAQEFDVSALAEHFPMNDWAGLIERTSRLQDMSCTNQLMGLIEKPVG